MTQAWRLLRVVTEMKIQSWLWSLGLLVVLVWNTGLLAQAKSRYGLRPVDETALGKRIPLILIHGINPKPAQDYGWRGFLRATATNIKFQQQYKSYFFIYPTAASVSENGERLQQTLLAFKKQNPDSPSFRIVALSLGGLLAKVAMEHEHLRQTTDRVIGIGVPFHGSPLANPQWVRAVLAKRSPLNLMRLNHRLAYGITRRRFPHFEKDFHWDNFDGALPENMVSLTAPASKNEQAADVSGMPVEKGPEFHTYAAFFGQSQAEEQWLLKTLQLKAQPEPTKSKRHCLISRHVAFQLAQPCLASLPMSWPESESWLSMMRLNDGISPISSQLWLGRFVEGKGQIAQEALWQAIIGLRGSHAARLFEGLDHRDWLTGKTRYKNNDGRVADWFHPNEAPKTIFDWLLTDLSD
jgi:hypothetical protein